MGGSVTINEATVKKCRNSEISSPSQKQLHQHRYFNPPAPFLASIKVDNVNCTAEQSQESVFSLFLPLTGVVWGKKKHPKNKKSCLQVCFVASHVKVVKGDTSSEEQTQHLLNAPFSSLLGLSACFLFVFCPVLFYSLFVVFVAPLHQ